MHKNLAVIILAAGKSTRMKSDIPKVLHPICGRPMLNFVLDLAVSLRADKIITVLGHRQERVRGLLEPWMKVVVQKRLLGTANAVKKALPLLKNFKGSVLVLYGDNPLLKKETIIKLLKTHRENNSDVTLLVAQLKNPAGYGRVLRDRYSSICGIAEDKDADDFQMDIKEINTGIMCFDKEKLFSAIKYIRPDNRKREYYLTDIVGIFYKKGYLINSVKLTDINEAQGINSRADLSRANLIMHSRINEDLMRKGITIIDPRSTFINFGAKISPDTTIYPFTVIESNVKIGKRCSVGPFIHLREGTVLENDVIAGNFTEFVRSRVGPKTLIKHFSYLGDSRIGRQVNIGAGTVTANFDGRKKNITVIDDLAFIGSDSVLIAPVKIGRAAVTGAGSVVTRKKNVPGGVTVVGVPARPLKRHK